TDIEKYDDFLLQNQVFGAPGQEFAPLAAEKYSRKQPVAELVRVSELQQPQVPRYAVASLTSAWASSSAGRAPRSQRGGRQFDPGLVHQALPRSKQGQISQARPNQLQAPCILSPWGIV